MMDPAVERVLVMAPFGRDAPVLRQVLGSVGIEAVEGRDEQDLVRLIEERIDVLVLTEEALSPATVADLLAMLSRQPAWSDWPMVLLTTGNPLEAEHAGTVAALRAAGNVTVLERPVRALTLVSAVQAALRARRRQYQTCALVQSETVARQQAEAALTLQEEFLATVSHELRTPLAAILLWTRLMTDDRLEPARWPHALNAIQISAQAQSKLIEDLLDASRIASGILDLKLRQVDVAAVVRGALDVVLGEAATKGIEIDTRIEQDAVVWGDPDRLQQVLWNLLNNAMKFTKPDGRVSVRLTRGPTHARIEVSDTGQGISPEFLPLVFERFRQAQATSERVHGGLGLGLSISRDLVVLHGGTLRAESPGEGHGAVFTLELPLLASHRIARSTGEAAHERSESSSRPQ
jgi:signal transduction histidine kinase